MSIVVNLEIGDVIRNGNHFWKVTGIYLGGLNQENLIGLRVDSAKLNGTAHGKEIVEMFMPETLLLCTIMGGMVEHYRKPDYEKKMHEERTKNLKTKGE